MDTRRHETPIAATLVLVLAAGLAACSDTVTIPPQTRLVASMSAELDPESAAVGDSVTVELAGDLRGENGVLLEKGTLIHGTVTAVQEQQGQWPLVVTLDFTHVEVSGTRHALASRVTSVDAETRSSDDSEAAATGGLVGSVVAGRQGAAMVRPDIRKKAGTPVALGTAATTGYLPAGARVELEVTETLELPGPADG